MATNDPVNDRYNAPSLNSVDFERFTFGELEVVLFLFLEQAGQSLVPWVQQCLISGWLFVARAYSSHPVKSAIQVDHPLHIWTSSHKYFWHLTRTKSHLGSEKKWDF